MKLNGNLTLNALGASQIENAVLERITGALPTVQASEAGRIIYHTDDSTFYFNNATSWVAFATGGSATAIQSEVDAIETSLGTGISAAGAFVGASFTGVASGATSFTDAINLVAAAVAGKDQLSELLDVNVTGVVNGQFLQYNGTSLNWEDHTLVLADVSDVTATAAEVNVLSGIPAGLTATELGYVDGVTGPIQTQLDGKQPLDTTLTGLAALAGTGIVVETAADTFTNRTLVAPAAGITISDAAGLAGNPTFVLANDLAAYEGLITNGYVVRTGDGTATTRSMSVVAGDLVITGDASGVSTDTTFGLDTVTQANSGNFVKVTLDTKGRVVGNTAVVTSDITALVDATYVNISGDTMTGALAMGGFAITGLPGIQDTTPTAATSKAYVDSLVAAGATWRNPVVDVDLSDAVTAEPTLTPYGATYLALAAAAGTWTGSVTVAAGDVVTSKQDGSGWLVIKNIAVGDRFLVAVEYGSVGATFAGFATPIVVGDLIEFNGTGTGAALSDWSFPEGYSGLSTGTPEMAQGITVLDATNTSEHYGHTYLYDAVSNAWVEIAGPGSIGAGTGLSYTGSTLNIGLGAGIRELPTDEVGIDLYDEPNGAIILTVDGATHTTATGAKLYLHLDAAGALAQTASGLKIAATSVTNAMLVNSGVTVNGDAGTGTLSLGGTLEVKGTSTQGITTSVNGTGTFTITASDASASQKGVATFNAADFTVASGDVTIAAGGVSNTQLANSSITVAGNTGSDAVALGGTLTVAGAGAISTAEATGTVTISVATATDTVLGVASFDAAQFSVTAGAVSLNATLGDLTNVDAATADVTTAGTMLVNDGTDYKGRKIYYLYTGASNTTHVVTHSLGQKYCNVTVVDSTDEVIIPQSITFNSASQLTVVFNTAIACTVVVMGV